MEIYDTTSDAGQTRAAEHSMIVSQQRLSAFVESLPSDVLAQEDSLPVELSKLNAAPRAKLQKIYRLLNRIGAASAGFTACSRGCSDCCKMNVTISELEANQISDHTGRQARRLQQSISHEQSEFVGKPCPFLANDECSIYEHRPFVCRRHLNFDATPYWCHPSRSLAVEIKVLGLGGADLAYHQIVHSRGNPILADIRDFFPE